MLFVIETTKVEVVPFKEVSKTMPTRKVKGARGLIIGKRFMSNLFSNWLEEVDYI